MRTIKIILQEVITDKIQYHLNQVIGRMKHSNNIKDMWLNIQHLDVCMDEDLAKTPVFANFDKKDEIIDFRDEDGTLIFYAQEI